MDTVTNLILYARKSSEAEDRQILSIDSQIDELKKVVQKDGLTIGDIMSEAHSAKAPGRPVFNTVLDLIEAGKADGLIVWNPDRLSRNSVDTGRLIYLLDIGRLKAIITPSQTFHNTPNDKFLLSLLCSQAKLDNDNKSINVKRGLRAKCERGIFPCPAPTGYLNDKYAEKGNKSLICDPDRFQIMQRMFKLILSQKHTPIKVLDIVNNEWKFKNRLGKCISRSNFYHILSNPVYAGTFEYPIKSGNWYKGIHEPMITEEEYDMIQAILGNKGKPRPKKHVFAFTGIMRCGECGAGITCEEKHKNLKNGTVNRYAYYHCTKRIKLDCSQKYIEEQKLEEQIKSVLDSIEIPSEFNDWALRWLKSQNHIEVEDRNKIKEMQVKQFDQYVNKLDTLIDMRAGKEITEEEYKTKREKLLKEKGQVEELLNDTHKRIDRWHKKADEMFDFARDAREEFENGDMQKKREILTQLGSNLKLFEGLLLPDATDEFISMKKLSTEVRLIYKRLEPCDKPATTVQMEELFAASPILLGDRDSNPDTQLQRLLSCH